VFFALSYKDAQLRGRVVERRPDGDSKYIDPISIKYTSHGDSAFRRNQSFARCTNFAHLATLMPDGSPRSVAIWVGHEGDLHGTRQSIGRREA